jgi:hypothetical protein
MLLLPALNAMIDISSTRTVALQTHQPMLVFVMLAISMLASALVAGFDMESRTRSWAHVICFTVLGHPLHDVFGLSSPIRKIEDAACSRNARRRGGLRASHDSLQG